MKLVYFYKELKSMSPYRQTDGGRDGGTEEYFAFLQAQKNQVKQEITWN